MTIEVRELVIEARVNNLEPRESSLNATSQALNISDEQLIRHLEKRIVRQVLARLRDDVRGGR